MADAATFARLYGPPLAAAIVRSMTIAMLWTWTIIASAAAWIYTSSTQRLIAGRDRRAPALPARAQFSSASTAVRPPPLPPGLRPTIAALPPPMQKVEPARAGLTKRLLHGAWMTVVVGYFLLRMAWPWLSGSTSRDSVTLRNGMAPPATHTVGLRATDLAQASQTITGGWTSVHDLRPDSTVAWTGSTSVFNVTGGRVLVVTNKHCLGLEQLAQSAWDNQPVVGQYALSVRFPSGVERPVLRFAAQAGQLDLAILEVDSAGLRAGVDYVVLPFAPPADLHAGDEIVCVGSPLGLEGTQTFGRVSAIRSADDGGLAYRFVQTDAAINPGNSGGPMFVKRGDRHHWIGVNTLKFTGMDNLGFAIHADAFFATKFYWYAADKAGAAQAIGQQYGVKATAR